MVMAAFICGMLSTILGVLIGWAISDKTQEVKKKGVVTYAPDYKETGP